MKVENAVYPDKEQMAGFPEAGNDGPIYRVKLLRFEDQAEYENDRDTDLTGKEAYDQYGAAGLAGQLNIETVDGSGLWLGRAGFAREENV